MKSVKLKLIENGKRPEYKKQGDACADCYAKIEEDSITLKKGERKLVNLGFAIELPEGYEAIIRPRSGNSLRGIDICIGTIDSGYRGELKACVINNSAEDFIIKNGDRICQLKIQKAEQFSFDEVEKLSDTERGSSGFGSTGV